MVAWKRKVMGGVVAFIGYMLSPLSWWNDLFVNVPLALAFAWVVSLFWKPAFEGACVVGYWLTNVLGFILMHKGAQSAISDRPRAHGCSCPSRPGRRPAGGVGTSRPPP